MSQSILMGYDDVSKLIGVPVNTLKDYRAKGKGPRSAVVAGKVKYRRADVLAWVDECFAESPTRTSAVFTPLGKRGDQVRR